MEAIMQRRQKEAAAAYEAQWANGSGSFHCDYDPEAQVCDDFRKASRETEELYNAIVKSDVAMVSLPLPVHNLTYIPLGCLVQPLY
jgi:hypothetical protein